MPTNRKRYILCIVVLLLLGVATPLCAQTIKGNVYGGGEKGKVAGNTSVTIASGLVETGASGGSNVFGGGLEAEVAGNTTIDINGGEVGNVYGGGEAANIVVGAAETGKTIVNMNGGTVHHSVYGGGLGNTTNVAISTTVTANGGTVTEDVYGGSGFGTVGATAVTINNGATVTRDVFGGGFGSESPDNYEADVIGAASVIINKGAKIRGNVYGGNNTNGSPKGAITVLVNGPADESEKTAAPLNLNDVFGGGKNAATTSSSNDIPAPKVTIRGCETVIERVFGGGDAASASATDVEIWGGHIGNAFAGGNGEVVAAHVGYLADGTTPYTYGTGNTSIAIKGGVIENVFGGSNTAGNIRGEVSVTVEKDDAACHMQITNLYGGGNEAPGKAGTISIVCTGDGRIENVYGGANKADVTGDITLNIAGGQIANVFGGNNVSGNIDGAITVNIDWDMENPCAANSLANVYGGGNMAAYTTPDGKEGPTVNLINGTVSNNVYGGGKGETAVVTGNPAVNLTGATVANNIFGGGDAAPVSGNPSVVANYGSVNDIFAGGRGETAHVTGDPKAYLQGATVTGNIFGGGDAAPVTGHPGVEAVSGIATNIFGGGKGATAIVTGRPHVNIGVEGQTHELTVTQDVYGGGDAAEVIGDPTVHVFNDCGVALNNVYGGGNAANVSATNVLIDGGVISGMVFGGGHGNKGAGISADVTDPDGYVAILVAGGTINQLFGGSNQMGDIQGHVKISVIKGADACPMHIGELYGGGNEASGNAGLISILTTGDKAAGEGIGDVYGGARNADVTSDISLSINGGSIDRVFGGNNMGGAISGSVTVTLEDALLSDDLFVRDVYGGGNQADYAGSPVVTINKGTVSGNVYGGGALADVGGNTTVNLTGGSVGGAYGGGLGSDEVAAIVGGNTLVTLNGSKVTGDGVFGANNLNGTPLGHVKVHVLRTTPRDGQGAGEYDVPAVYGGGNLSAYQPTDPNDFAEVLIENCDNSINYVYGGGNAAPVPATSVTIYGANAIDHAFAGGNGAGYGNPGADVGYLDYTRDEAHKYGTGKSAITVYGGTVNNVYGGSNTLGYIWGGTTISVEKEGDCPLVVGNVFGGGNEADIDCDVTMNLDCSEGGATLYAGANNANVGGDITLNISSGTYGKVFCGNNVGGRIYGSLKVNVDETGCWPVMIGELYACGNLAPYSVYGYDGGGTLLTEGERRYKDPEVNLISFTRIGKVFGGGYGRTAILYGNTHVNVEPVKGKFAGYDASTPDKQISPAFVLNGNDERVPFDEASTLPYHITKSGDWLVIPDEAGSIGTIYGGGNAGAVYGNTHVKIGTLEQNHHVSGTDQSTEEEVYTTITGNVFGGGNEAIVSGDTHVQIGPKDGE